MTRRSQLLIIILILLQVCGCSQVRQEEIIVPDEMFNTFNGEQYTNVETNIVDFKYAYNEKKFLIQFIWCEIDGEITVRKTAEGDMVQFWSVTTVEDNPAIVQISLLDSDGMVYMIWYDLYEEAVMDLLAEIPEELKKEINHIAIASDLSKALVECYKGETVFVYNILEECLTELGELTELEGADSAYFLKDDLLLVNDREGTDNRNFTVELYTYNFSTGDVIKVVERMPLYNQNYQPEGIELKGSDFALMYINNETYKVDLLTGEKYLLE